MRTAVPAALLLIGIAWSLPMQPGHDGRETVATRYPATVLPAFSISFTRGILALSGHTVSTAHEQRLREAAARHFPESELEAAFRPLGVAPDWWGVATTVLLEAVADIDAPRVSMTDDTVNIRGIVSNRTLSEQRLLAVAAALPDSVEFDLRLTEIDPALSPTALCQRQLGSLRFAPVYFDESGTRMRTSAIPVLEQVAAFADACRDTRVSITGHTDSSGDENYNRALSLARARVVADWLQESGIEGDRLEVAGVGSSVPVADNATRFGRGLNRRIDIRFSANPSE
ncbi:MAG: OmpA family protein [Woeseiaceae bacterium]|nr:OmpA family protein [Woeseiaceae bacterium]